VHRNIHLQVTPVRCLCQCLVDTIQPSPTDASLSLSMNLILEAFMRALNLQYWRDIGVTRHSLVSKVCS
jgi:hypothetical protein